MSVRQESISRNVLATFFHILHFIGGVSGWGSDHAYGPCIGKMKGEVINLLRDIKVKLYLDFQIFAPTQGH